MENPFTLKVGQMFTGFGIGCGVGIGVGRPLYLGAIPALQQVMSATRGATDAFSGVGRHVNNSQTAVKMMSKIGIAPGSINQSIIPGSLQSSMNMVTPTSSANIQNTVSNAMQSASTTISTTSNGQRGEDLGSHSEKVINNFLQSPILKEEETEINELAGQLRSENNICQVLLKHQRIIEELMEENEKLHRVLTEDLNVSPSKLQSANRRLESQNPCSDCFDCRRRRRKSTR